LHPSSRYEVQTKEGVAAGRSQGGTFSNGSGSFRRAQVITAGASGLLGRVEVQTDTSAFSGFNILAVQNGLPTETVLGTAAYQFSAGGFASFTSFLPVTQGQQFALEPIASGLWFSKAPDGYAGGTSAFLNVNTGVTTFSATDDDYDFRTYVDGDLVFGPLALDQSFTAAGNVGGVISAPSGSIRRAQIVTAGVTGWLGRVEVQASAASFSGFNILAVRNGLPTGVVLGTAIYQSSADGFASFISSALVTQGQQFALEPIGVGSWRAGGPGDYAGGFSVVQNPGTDVFTPSDDDFGFRTFIAERLAVPEPATWAMMVMGFGLVGAGLRHRKAAAQPALG
jgi:hypothetical protein